MKSIKITKRSSLKIKIGKNTRYFKLPLCLIILIYASCKNSNVHPDLKQGHKETSSINIASKKCSNCNGKGKIKRVRYVAGRGNMNERTISYGGKEKRVYYETCLFCNGTGNVNK